MELTVGGKYKLGIKLGHGSFGDIYRGVNSQTNEEVAIKLENTKSRHHQLFYEVKLYKIFQGGVGVPNIHWYGVEVKNFLTNFFNEMKLIFLKRENIMLWLWIFWDLL